MSKRLAVGLIVMLTALGSVTPPAAARTSRIYHTIVSFDAFAMYSQETECRRVDVYVSTSRAMYAAQPGPVTKQGLTGVELIVADTCAVSAAAGGGDERVIFDGQGLVDTAPAIPPQLGSARVEAALPLEDNITGEVVWAHLDATWSATGPIEKAPYSYNDHVSHVGGTRTHELMRSRPATARVSLSSSLARVSGTISDASIQQEKFRCMEVVLPHYSGDSNWCFGAVGS